MSCVLLFVRSESVFNCSNANIVFLVFTHMYIDTLDSYRISRTFDGKPTDQVKVPSAGASSLNNTSSSSSSNNNSGPTCDNGDKWTNDVTDGYRDMQDVLGPLPALPVNNDECTSSGRWSMRRTSGVSGIYEEILDDVDG